MVSLPNSSMKTGLAVPLELSTNWVGLIHVLVAPRTDSTCDRPQTELPETLMKELFDAVPVVNLKTLAMAS